MDQNISVENIRKSIVWDLKEFRRIQAESKVRIDALQAELDNDPRYQAIKAEQKALAEYVAAEEEARQRLLALAMTQFDGINKRPMKGVQVKEFRTAVITDMKKAMAWASTYLPSAITLNVKAVGKAAENLEVDFVEVQSEFRPNLVEKELDE